VSPAEQKQALRARIRAAVRALPPAARADAGRAIGRRIRQVCGSPRSALLFWPLADEPDFGKLFDLARNACLPRYCPDTDSYEAAVIRDPDADLSPGRFGIPEPRPECPALPLKQLDLVLVPGVAFSPCGARLGRGRGFYDRLLRRVSGRKIGVAFDEQIVEAIPSEAHDEPVDGIITPTRWIDALNFTGRGPRE